MPPFSSMPFRDRALPAPLQRRAPHMTSGDQSRRLWIVSELYYPEMTSTGYYITHIAEFLTDHVDVRVICGKPNYSARGVRVDRNETRHGVEISRVPAFRLNKNILFFRLLNALSLSIGVFIKELISIRAGDSVVVVTTPPVLPFITALAALMKGASYMVLVHDVYPEQLIATGILKRGSVVAWCFDLMNRCVYKHAASIIAVGRDMKELLETKLSGLDIPVPFIPNWAETDTITPQDRKENPLLREIGFEDKFVVLSAGNFGRPNDLETIVRAAERLSADTRVQFLFIGNGAKLKWLKARTSTLSNILILPPMPRERQNVFLNACDATVVSLVRGMLGAAVPSRTYNYMAAGKPLLAICERHSEIAGIIQENEIGKWVEPGDSEGLAAAIHDLLSRGTDLRRMSERARAAAVDKYSPGMVLPQFRDALIGRK